MSHLKFIVICSLILIISACSELGFNDEAEIHIKGTVTYMELEGGFWVIQDEEHTYDPLNLPDEFKKQDLKVSVAANIEEDMVSIHQVGPIIDIVSIKKR